MRTTILLSALMMLAACGDDATGTPDAGPGGSDAGGMADSGPGTDAGGGGLSCADRVPERPFGTAAGYRMEPFMLQDCNGDEYEFYNEDYCESSITVVSIAAGWCMPCIMESMQLEAEINDRYAAQNVRVVQIIVQKEDGSQPDLAYCTNWVNRFGLSNVELIDPLQVTNIYFPDGVLPSTIIVDDTGTIRFRENGATDGLTSLRARIEEVLMQMGRL
jgi:thiol-disulfide isomerase/thioredoxin